jgi:hypothetical protein
MRRINSDGIVGLALIVICAELFRETYNFRVPPFATMSTATWPRVVLIVLAMLAVALLIQSMRQAPVASGSAVETPPLASHRNAVICFGLFAAFLVSLHWLGMLIAGFVFVFLMQELMGPRDMKSRLVHVAIAAVSVGGMWAVFTFALRVILPEGILVRI